MGEFSWASAIQNAAECRQGKQGADNFCSNKNWWGFDYDDKHNRNPSAWFYKYKYYEFGAGLY